MSGEILKYRIVSLMRPGDGEQMHRKVVNGMLGIALMMALDVALG